ncbi:MAG: aminotransferase class I/II-fold pyridoxal phosphate-dependent enzyme [Salinivirgaceae bacterium]
MKFEHSIRGKIADFGTMVFSEFSRLFNEHRAIDLARGFPHFKRNERLLALIQKHIAEDRNHYLSVNGHKGLRKNIAQLYQKYYGATYDGSTEVTITAGASQAIYTILSSMVRENDEVIIFEPAYDLYAPTVEVNQGKPVYVKLEQPDFHIDWGKVQKLITPQTRMIIITNPNNPTGSLLKAHDLQELQRTVNGTDILLLSDESLQFLVYDGYEHHSIASSENLAKRSFVVGGFGKTFQITGWRTGFCLAPEDLMHEFRKLHQYIAFNVNSAAQFALSDYLDEDVDFKPIASEFAAKRDYFCQLLENTPFKAVPVKSGIFQPVTFETTTGYTDMELALKLIKEVGVAGVPLSAYAHDKTNYGMLRFCFARPDNLLEEAAEKLKTIDFL